MKLLALSIRAFRGIQEANIRFGDHDILVGPNGAGKSTIINAMSLVFVRSRLVRDLTEHLLRFEDDETQQHYRKGRPVMISSPQRIRDLCRDWLAAAQQPGGGFSLRGDTEQYRLLRNGVVFPELSLEGLRVACVGLTEVLLLPGMNTVIDLDHQLFWSWMGQVLLAPEAGVFGNDEREISELFGACIRASLAGIRPPTASPEDWESQKRQFHIHEPNARHLVQNAHFVLAFLALPLLEAITRRIASAYVDFSGAVLQTWSVPAQGGGCRTYSPSGTGSRRCSSVRDLLYLVRDAVAGPALQAALDEMRTVFHNRDASVDAFDAIYAWRNESLHGQTTHRTIGGTVLNLSILVSLEFVAADYEAHRGLALAQARREQQTEALSGSRTDWSYYPPY